MTADITPPVSILALLPELLLVTAGSAVLLLGQAQREPLRRWTAGLTLAALAAALILTKLFLETGARFAIDFERSGAGLTYGPLADFVRTATLVLGVLITLVAWSQPQPGERGEFFSMLLFSLAGLMLVGPANNLLLLFLALELVSIPNYVIVTLSRRRLAALEAGTKYFYLGALAAAVNAYGFSFLYGVSGTATIDSTVEAVKAALTQPGTLAYGLAVVGLLLSIGGLLFKIAAVPLHFYIADVYQGAASPVAGLLGFVPKLAGLAAIFKIIALTDHWRNIEPGVYWLLWIVAAASMTVGNVLALMQTNVKRILAYSGVAHAGYMLVGVLAGPVGSEGLIGDGTAAVLFYAVVYGIANLGAFAILGLLRVRGEPCETLRDLAGLLRRHAGMALLLALAMITLMGLPPTPGFWGKLSLFGSALALSANEGLPPGICEWTVALVVVAVVNSAIAAAYYLRVVAAVLLYESDHPAHAVERAAQHMGAVMCGVLLLIFAFYPHSLMTAGRFASSDLRPPPFDIHAAAQSPAGAPATSAGPPLPPSAAPARAHAAR